MFLNGVSFGLLLDLNHLLTHIRRDDVASKSLNVHPSVS